jgi:ApaG protein
MSNPIQVEVQTEYLEQQSSREQGRYVFAYHIAIHNRGNQPAQLLRRHWIITDGNQHVQEVEGEGVVGEQPVIPPGASYHYSSGAVLQTPIGSMQGSYQMQTPDGELFKTAIPTFSLNSRRMLH